MTASPAAFAGLLRSAVEDPGIVSNAYRQFHIYSVGNQLLAWQQCQARGVQPGPLATYQRWRELGRYVPRGEKAITLCRPVTVKRTTPADHGTEESETVTWFSRRHYNELDFVVPDHAMSAGTVLVMSGDAIYMDYYSVLGPIDPQVERPGVGLVPALGYLQLFDRLVEKSKRGTLTTAELTYLVQKFNPAELYQCEQARELSIAVLKEWLVKYKQSNLITTVCPAIPTKSLSS